MLCSRCIPFLRRCKSTSVIVSIILLGNITLALRDLASSVNLEVMKADRVGILLLGVVALQQQQLLLLLLLPPLDGQVV